MRGTRKRAAVLLAVALGVAIVLTTVPGVSAQSRSVGTARASHSSLAPGTALDIALDYIRAHKHELGLKGSDVKNLVVTDEYADSATGATYIYLQQKIGDVRVVGGVLNVAVARDGSVLTLGDRSVDVSAPSGQLKKDAREAVAAAAEKAGASPSDATGQPELVYTQTGSGLRLAWQVHVDADSTHWYETLVDAESGDVISQDNYVEDAVPETSVHNVFPIPFESPNDGARVAVSNPPDPVASPFGWNDTNGIPGAEDTHTIGNNVSAYVDAIGGTNDDLPDPGSSPDGGPSLTFDFPFDLSTQQPAQYRPFAVSNLYYWNNIVHDVLFHAGFDEISGNFQTRNYSGKGAGGDAVRAEAQDNSGLNNANFSTFPDGQPPRMQMYVWRSATELTVTSPAGAAGTYSTGSAGFGPPFGAAGLSGTIVLAQDAANAAGARTDDACTVITNPAEVAGKIAIARRGGCEFSTKAENVQNAGAIALIVQNNNGGPAFTLGAGVRAPFVTIPAAGISDADGATLRANLPATGSIKSLFLDRDSDLDSGVIAHEYGHGWSNRLTGGPSNVSCLRTSLDPEQMGEGWSDFLALTMTAKPGDAATTPRGMGTYVSFQNRSDIGIRPTQYSTDMSVNPSTYNTVKTGVTAGTLTVPHGVGYVWASMLWEVYWNLVHQYGFNPNIYDDWTTGGNNLALRLVSDGMKFQPCSPGFVDGRNAILLADQALTGGKNQCLIWKGFAKRGLGLNANQGVAANPAGSTDPNFGAKDGTEDFTLPAFCASPAIATNPASLSATLLKGSGASATGTLTIANARLYGAASLTWSVAEAASDCASASDVPWLSASPASGSTAAGASSSVVATLSSAGLDIGTYSARLCVASNDPASALVAVPVTLTINYPFSGGDDLGNANAGSSIPVRFSLGGNQGLDVFAAGMPASAPVDCATKGATGAATQAQNPGSSGLSYDATSDRYQYVWKTEKAWAGSCRALVLGLKDGTQHSVFVHFK